METQTETLVAEEQEQLKVKEQKKPFFKNPIPKINLAALAKKLSPIKKAKENETQTGEESAPVNVETEGATNNAEAKALTEIKENQDVPPVYIPTAVVHSNETSWFWNACRCGVE